MDWMINHNYRHITNQDLSKLVKIEPETVNLLQIKRNGRIIQSRVESILHERFSSHLFKLELKWIDIWLKGTLVFFYIIGFELINHNFLNKEFKHWCYIEL